MDADDIDAKQKLNAMDEEIETFKSIVGDKERLIVELDGVVAALRTELEELNANPVAYADGWIKDVRLDNLESELQQKQNEIAQLKIENENVKSVRTGLQVDAYSKIESLTVS